VVSPPVRSAEAPPAHDVRARRFGILACTPLAVMRGRGAYTVWAPVRRVGSPWLSALGARLSVLREPASVARALAVAVFVALALSSAVRTWPDTWYAFGHERESLAGQATSPPLAFAVRGVGVDPGVLDFYALYLRAGDRYAFQPSPDLPAPAYQSMLLISAVALLPAVRVEDPGDADVLLSYFADPRALYPVNPRDQLGALPHFVTRLRP
jgi:hypothetical protein